MRARADNIKLAISVTIAGVFALSLGDALVKKFNADFNVWQIFILRSALVLPPLIAFIKLRLPADAIPRDELRWCALRSAMLVIMWLAYYAALPHLQLPPAAAMFYTTPIFIVLFSIVFIGGGVGMRGWIAVLIGFCGALLILRPRAGDFNVYALLPLLSAILFSLAMILTRIRCRGTHPLALVLGLHLAFFAIGVAGAIATTFTAALQPELQTQQPFLFADFGWINMTAREWGVMSALALAALVGSFGPAYAYQFAPPPVVAPFGFAYLAFALLWGLIFFADVPGVTGMTGILLITAAGLLALRRGT